MDDHVMPLRPGEFCRLSLKAQEGADGQRKRRKRDQRPDRIGLQVKSDLLVRAAEDDPEPEAFEAWLLAQVIAAPAGGPVRAMSLQILEEYRVALIDEALARWLRAGAPTDDALPDRRQRSDEIPVCGCSASYLRIRDT